MAFTEFGTNSPQAVKRWSDRAFRETFGKMGLKGMVGRGPGSCIQLMTELEKGAGDEIKYDLLLQDRGNGVNGDTTLEGFEDDLDFQQDILRVNQKRKGTKFKRMSQQRTIHDLRRDGRFSLTEWGAWFFEAGTMAHLAGVVGDGNENISGALGVTASGQADFAGNTLTALDSDHFISTGSTMTLSDIDDAVAKAKDNNPRLPPLRVNGEMKYCLYLHHFAVRSLMKDAAANSITWNDLMKNAESRGKGNPVYTGALGEYHGVILKESEFVPRVGNVSHNLMVGASAGCLAFGNAWDKTSRAGGGGGSYFELLEQERDYKNSKGMGLTTVCGFKRANFDGKAFGVMGIQSTEAP